MSQPGLASFEEPAPEPGWWKWWAPRANIPRIVHMTWMTKDLTGLPRRAVASWRSVNRGYDVRVYDDEDCDRFIREKRPQWHPTYQRLEKPVERADFWRLIVLHAEGGVYSDIDCIAQRPMDRLFRRHPHARFLCGLEASGTEEDRRAFGWVRHHQLCQWCFASEAGHPALSSAIARVVENVAAGETALRARLPEELREHPDAIVLERTGPGAFTDAVLPLRDRSDVVIGPIGWFGAGQKHSNAPPKRKGYVAHEFLNSWHARKERGAGGGTE